MGITVSPASSSGGGGGSSGTLPVIPGTSVEREIYTDTGFTTGEYVYRYGSGNVGTPPAVANGVVYKAVNIYSQYSNTFNELNIYPQSYTRAAVTNPVEINLSYTGSTVNYGDQTHATSDLSTSNSGQVPASAKMANGNVVSIFNGNTTDGTYGTIYYSIIEPDGTEVYSGTIATDMYTGAPGVSYGRNYDVCATAAGGFAVTYRSTTTLSSSYIRIGTFDNSGAQVLAFASVGTSTPYIAYNPKILQNPSTGDFYVYGQYATTVSGTYQGIVRLDSSLSQLNYAAFSTSYQVYYWAFDWAMLESGDIAAFWNYSSNLIGVSVNKTTLSSSVNILGGITSTAKVKACKLGGGNVAAFAPSNSTSYFFWAVIENSGGVHGWALTSIPDWTSNNDFTLCTYDGPNDGTYSSSGNDSLTLYYGPNTSSYYSSRIITWNSYAAAGPQLGPLVATSVAKANVADICALSLNNGSDGFFYKETGDAKPLYYSRAVIPIQNGEAYPSVDISYSGGYRLLGIATTTAAADSVGSIAINGVASLSSSYGSSSVVTYFNFDPYNIDSSLDGNVGYVVNRTVTLTGLES